MVASDVLLEDGNEVARADKLAIGG